MLNVIRTSKENKKHFSERRFDVSCVFQAARLIVNNLNKLAHLLRFQNVCMSETSENCWNNDYRWDHFQRWFRC